MQSYLNCDVFMYLKSKGTNINMVSSKGNTMLMQAVKNSNKEIISYLLSCEGVNIRMKNQYNKDALNLTIEYCSNHIIWTIIKRDGYTKEEIIRAYELESCFQYISGKFHESNASWQKALSLRDLPMNTPISDNC